MLRSDREHHSDDDSTVAVFPRQWQLGDQCDIDLRDDLLELPRSRLKFSREDVVLTIVTGSSSGSVTVTSVSYCLAGTGARQIIRSKGQKSVWSFIDMLHDAVDDGAEDSDSEQ